MAELSHQLVQQLASDSSIKVRREGNLLKKRNLEISFNRTLRVSDNNTINYLPPSLGNFPLFKVSDYEGIPAAMKAKGGYFLPMHRTLFLWWLPNLS